MVNLDSYIDSRRIKFIYRIEPIENWNAIGKSKMIRLLSCDYYSVRTVLKSQYENDTQEIIDNRKTLIVPNYGYFRNTWCALNLISKFLLLYLIHLALNVLQLHQ
jgi:hypothetical protein